MNAFIEKKVHELYWDCDVNCARTMLICLGELFGVTYELYLNGLGWEEERIFTRRSASQMRSTDLPGGGIYI